MCSLNTVGRHNSTPRALPRCVCDHPLWHAQFQEQPPYAPPPPSSHQQEVMGETLARWNRQGSQRGNILILASFSGQNWYFSTYVALWMFVRRLTYVIYSLYNAEVLIFCTCYSQNDVQFDIMGCMTCVCPERCNGGQCGGTARQESGNHGESVTTPSLGLSTLCCAYLCSSMVKPRYTSQMTPRPSITARTINSKTCSRKSYFLIYYNFR